MPVPAGVDAGPHFFPREILFEPLVGVDRAGNEVMKIERPIGLAKLAVHRAVN
jgi:hypothetical protein